MGLDKTDTKFLMAAEGYADLALWLDANAELERINPDVWHVPEVLFLRERIYRALEKWDLMAVAGRPALDDRDDVSAAIELAYAARRENCIEGARLILSSAVNRLPGSTVLEYELARCECQLGEIESAKGRLHRAFSLHPELRLQALEDDELAPLWDTIPIL